MPLKADTPPSMFAVLKAEEAREAATFGLCPQVQSGPEIRFVTHPDGAVQFKRDRWPQYSDSFYAASSPLIVVAGFAAFDMQSPVMWMFAGGMAAIMISAQIFFSLISIWEDRELPFFRPCEDHVVEVYDSARVSVILEGAYIGLVLSKWVRTRLKAKPYTDEDGITYATIFLMGTVRGGDGALAAVPVAMGRRNLTGPAAKLAEQLRIPGIEQEKSSRELKFTSPVAGNAP